MDIAQRVAVVTGGASGIGRSLCLALAQQGAQAVVVADVDAGGAEQVAAQIEAGGQRALAVTADVASAALAEWLSITYGGRGIGVSCLCPQAVSTNLGATSRRELGSSGTAAPGASAPPDASSGPARQAAVDGVLTPGQVATCVLQAVAAEQFLILPHPQVASYERRRSGDRERWLRGMRRLQAQLQQGR